MSRNYKFENSEGWYSNRARCGSKTRALVVVRILNNKEYKKN